MQYAFVAICGQRIRKVNTHAMRSVKSNIKLNVNNHTVNYNDNGLEDAQAIIFIHGFPLNKSMWNLQMEVLKNNYRVIAYDIRGHGNSENTNTEFSIDLFATDLLCLMDELKLDKAILCGLSMGGYIALNAVENYPERFDGLVLSDTQCTADTHEAKEKRFKVIKSIEENGIEKYADESVKSLFASQSFQTRKKEIAAVRDMIMRTSKQTLCNTLLALSMRKETCHQLSEIKIPVLIIVGNEDKITPIESAQRIHKEIQESLLVVIGHAGHLSNLENPLEFNYQLKRFCDSVLNNFTAAHK